MIQQKIGIVIPCYNEEKRFDKEEFNSFYRKNNFIFCFVNDGSRDKTEELLLEIQKGRENRVYLINRNKNKGKAESVREGILFLQKRGDLSWIGFIDADFATPLNEIQPMLEIAYENELVKIVIGTRFKRMGADIQRNIMRFYIGRIFATLSSCLLGLPIYDTQCGAKIFRYDIIDKLFYKEFKSTWLFDVEIFYRVLNSQKKETAKKIIVEYPLRQWHEIKGSKLKIFDFIVLPTELLRLFLHYKIKPGN